jgi:hypothetical protein
MKEFSRLSRICLVVLLVVASCEESSDWASSPQIEYETACGWCAGSWRIIIEGNEVSYKRIIPCGENKGTIEKSRHLNADQLVILENSFDFDKFLKLDINECGVCFDGCDERLKISKEGKTHEIRYLITSVPVEADSLRILLQGILLQFDVE